ncbi:hypothetical protein AOLI_G00303350 [Acnodon oligacanthus]
MLPDSVPFPLLRDVMQPARASVFRKRDVSSLHLFCWPRVIPLKSAQRVSEGRAAKETFLPSTSLRSFPFFPSSAPEKCVLASQRGF